MRPGRWTFGLWALVTTAMALVINHSAFSDAPTPAAEPTGALSAFTAADPLIQQARKLLDEGHFADAAAVLKNARGGGKPAADEMLDVISRIRVAYSLDAAGLLAKVRESVPDATADDLDRWRRDGQVQFRMIDGRPCYFSREPANIFRFCEEAKRRQKPVPAEPAGWRREDHIARVIAAAEREGKAQVLPVRHRVRYVLTIPADAPHLKPGAAVRVWLPFPQEYRRQRDVKLLNTSPARCTVAPTATDEHPLQGAPQRSVYFEARVPERLGAMTFEEEFEFTSSAYYPELVDARARLLPADWSGGSLDERPPHIVFTSELRETVARVVGAETNPLVKARRIFNFVASNIAYCAEEEYGTIPSLSRKALKSHRGDCGVQSMLFITMCRATGIPARWQSGWETERVNVDMHDWAEFYVEPWGWLPADPSYGFCKSDDPRAHDFYFGHQDSYRLIVNRDYGCPLVPPKSSPRSEPLDFQRGEVEIDGHNLYFPNWTYDIQVEWLDDGP